MLRYELERMEVYDERNDSLASHWATKNGGSILPALNSSYPQPTRYI